MKTMFLSRKNLVAIAIAALFAFNFIVIGLLLFNIPEFNDILYYDMGLDIIPYDYCEVRDQVGLAITGVFLFLLVFGVIFIYRLGRINGHKFFSKKVVVPSIIYIAIWLVVVFLVNCISEFFNFGDLGLLLFTELIVFVMTLLSGIIISIPLGALIVIIVNFVNMGRPYGFLEKELMPDFGDANDETIVSDSFGEVKQEEETKESKPEEVKSKKAQYKKEAPKNASKPLEKKPAKGAKHEKK